MAAAHEEQPAVPMTEFWQPVKLTQGGRASLEPREVEYGTFQAVHLRHGEDWIPGELSVTTHRLLFHADAGSIVLGGSLAATERASVAHPKVFSRSRLLTVPIRPSHGAGQEVLKVKQGGDVAAAILEALEKALERKMWATDPEDGAAAKARVHGVTASGAGISGILRKQERDKRQTGHLATHAFADMKALMKQAETVVDIMQRYKAQIEAAEGGTGSGGAASAANEGAGGEGEVAEMRDLFLNIGISNPVTRSSAGSNFHKQLARQVADFLLEDSRLRRAGGLMTLPDLFCVFNRARGLELVSPEDLLEACRLLRPLRLPMHCRTFPTGVIVVEADDHDDQALAQRLRQEAEEHSFITPIVVATRLRIPLPLAREHIKIAEARGELCRDEGPSGVHFYPNRFDEYLAPLKNGLECH